IAGRLRDYIHALSYLEGFPQNLDNFSIPFNDWAKMGRRERVFHLTKAARISLHQWIAYYKADGMQQDISKFEETTGLRLLEQMPLEGLRAVGDKYPFEVHSFRGARRVGPDGDTVDEVIISLTQKRDVTLEENVLPANYDNAAKFRFRGGCTLILDLQTLKL